MIYDGLFLSEAEDILVVTTNYRLGALGWLTTDAASGNYGILDQIAALQWVKENITAFGGDPDRITIFGESAGARDVCVLVASERAGRTRHVEVLHRRTAKLCSALVKR